MFFKVTDDIDRERVDRLAVAEKMLTYGNTFLDEFTDGIAPNDLIMLGARSGGGKTQMATHIAYANIAAGNRVNFIALEASEFEIQRRLKFPLIAERYYSDPHRPPLGRLRYQCFIHGRYGTHLDKYEEQIIEHFRRVYANLSIYRYQDKFGLKDLITAIAVGSRDADLVILDHLHFLDIDEFHNENRAMKEIVSEARKLVLLEQKPIVVIAHLRKRDRNYAEIAPSMEEFHGSSDMYKLMTHVITLGSGRPMEDGNFESYIRIPKNRNESEKFLAKVVYSPRKGCYEPKYKLGWPGCEFKPIEDNLIPEFARHAVPTGPQGIVRSRPTRSEQSRADIYG